MLHQGRLLINVLYSRVLCFSYGVNWNRHQQRLSEIFPGQHGQYCLFLNGIGWMVISIAKKTVRICRLGGLNRSA